MEITEVRIKLMENPEDRLRGFCSITFDHCFVIRDLKIIEGNRGPFVAMPSRKLTSNCHKCRCKNHLRANYCNQCGAKLTGNKVEHDSNGRAKLYADIAHPINAECREAIQSRIVAELEKETALSKEPGYRSRYDEGYDDRPRSQRKEKQAASPKHSESKEKNNDSLSESLSDSEVAPGIGSQSEVETRIDIPRPSDRKITPPSNPGNKPAESLSSNTIRSAVADNQSNDADDSFGKGIF